MPSRLNFLLSAFGSGGDVMPLLSLGQTLRGRGHRVKVLTGGGFADVAARCGLDCVPVFPPERYEESLRDVHLLGSRHHPLFFRRHAVAWNAALLSMASRESRRDTVLLSTERSMMWGDLAAHRHHGLTCARIVVDPPPVSAGGAVRGAVAAKPSPRLVEAWQADWRQEAGKLGLSVGHNHVARLARATNRSVPRVAVWPKWLAPETTLAAQVLKFGFVGGPRLQGGGAFERQGRTNPLLVFMAGSVGTTRDWERGFERSSREICARLRCDGLLLGGNPTDDFEKSAGFAWRKHLPLDSVLPHAAAIVHHGGIGTAAAALEHGVPQLVVPRVFSQPANAEWLRRLGVAEVMQPASFSQGEGARGIAALIRDSSYRDTSLRLGAQIDAETERDRICSFVEELHRMRGSQGTASGAAGLARRPLPFPAQVNTAAREPILAFSTG